VSTEVPANVEVLAIGEALVAFIASDRGRPASAVEHWSSHVTGAELNTAVGLARLGHRVALAGRVGVDAFGEMIRRRLRTEGVDDRWLRDDDAPTGLLMRELRRTPPPAVTYRRAGSAGSRLVPRDLDEALDALAPGTVVHVSGVTAALGSGPLAALKAVAKHSANGALRLSLDLNYRSALWSPSDATAALAPLVEAAWIVFATSEEATMLTGSDGPSEASERLVALGAAHVFVRHGTIGALARRSGESAAVALDGRADPAALDPVGAGDAFAAGALSALLDGGDLAAALARAHYCGAAVVGAVGDIEGALDRDALAFVERNEVRR
jgi:2-dehydro-3-deoxygluconokinase